MRAGRPRSRVGILPLLMLLERARAGLQGCSPAHGILAGRVAGCPSQGNSAARYDSACGRDARAPGWASSHCSCCLSGHAPACRAAALPMAFSPAGWSGAHRRETQRHDSAVHAGGTPALPGGLLPSLLLLDGAGADLPGCSPAHGTLAGRLVGCLIAGKLSGTQRQCMRAGRPRSRVGLLPSLLLLEGAGAGLPGCRPGLWKFHLGGRDSANLAALSTQLARSFSDSMPAGSTSAHPFMVRPFMSAGLVCGSASVLSWFFCRGAR